VSKILLEDEPSVLFCLLQQFLEPLLLGAAIVSPSKPIFRNILRKDKMIILVNSTLSLTGHDVGAMGGLADDLVGKLLTLFLLESEAFTLLNGFLFGIVHIVEDGVLTQH